MYSRLLDRTVTTIKRAIIELILIPCDPAMSLDHGGQLYTWLWDSMGTFCSRHNPRLSPLTDSLSKEQRSLVKHQGML